RPREQRRGPRARDRLRMPGVDLAAVDDDLLRRDRRLLDLARRLAAEPALEEAHLVALRIRGDRAERVSLYHLLELRARAHDHRDLEPEGIADLPLALACDLGRRPRARAHDIAAPEVC